MCHKIMVRGYRTPEVMEMSNSWEKNKTTAPYKLLPAQVSLSQVPC